MTIDFDKIYDRSQNNAAKYEEMEMKFGRGDLIPLWVADMDFPAPEEVTAAMMKRAAQGIFGYTARPESYYVSMTQWYKAQHDWAIELPWVTHSPAVVTTLSILVEQMTIPGDQIVIQSPVYTPFYDVIKGRGCQVVENLLVQTQNGYVIDFDDLDEKLKHAKLMILCNPHNPVGRVWKKEELMKIGALCIKHNVRVLADEIHADFVFAPHKYVPFASLSKDIEAITITCLSATKTFNIAGLQASFAIFPRQEEKERFEQALGLLDIKRNNCFSLVAVDAAYKYGKTWLEGLLGHLKGNLEYAHEYIKKEMPMLIPNQPEGTYLLWIDCRALGLDDTALSQFMIHEAHVALGAGASYGLGGSGFMRMNVACSRKMLHQGLEQMKNALANKK